MPLVITVHSSSNICVKNRAQANLDLVSKMALDVKRSTTAWLKILNLRIIFIPYDLHPIIVLVDS